MERFVQWATILSPIIAVLIAWWTSRSGRKDTAAHISALAESTEKQIKSIKRLARLQAEVTKNQIERELMDARQNFLNSSKKMDDFFEMNNAPFSFMSDAKEIFSRHEKEKNLSYEQDFYKRQKESIEHYLSRLNKLSKELGLDVT